MTLVATFAKSSWGRGGRCGVPSVGTVLSDGQNDKFRLYR